MNRPVLVMGMHRSGTSAITRCLSLMGLSLGVEKHLMPAQPEQPKGYWELEPLRQENDRILQDLRGSWSNPPHFESDWVEKMGLEAVGRGADLLQEMFIIGGSWVWKDPRNCLLLPHWLRCLAVCRDNGPRNAPLLKPVIVFIHRDPFDVIASLKRSRGMLSTHALALWEKYNWAALRSMSGLPVAVVRFGALLDNPALELTRIGTFLRAHDVHCAQAPSYAALGVIDRKAPRNRTLARSAKSVTHKVLCELPPESNSFQGVAAA